MVQFKDLIDLQLMFFALMMVGYILCKLGIINRSNRKSLTNLVIYLVLPCNIINSFLIDMDLSTLQSCGFVLLISCAIQAGCLIFSRFLYPVGTAQEKAVLKYGTICSNAGFLGNPLIEGIYGSAGLLYASVYLIPQRFVMWSAGVSCFTEEKGKGAWKKILTHPCVVAVYIGFFLMLTPVTLPRFAYKTLDSLGGCTTALSMIVIGGILAEIDFRTVINKLTLYYSVLRLLAIPAVVLIFCRIFSFDPLVSAVSIVLAGMPAGSTTAILAEKYDGDSGFAVKCVFLSTLASFITIPAMCMLIEYIF